ncbi:hypothetical protein SAMN05443287_1258 [Micromonospora phaseoli]|uniref:Uncharacterized protein n=1 Tax=Micromonospora phaseoli TaxID=1144548 RepID=A0A1H7E2M2_9ACTN|nr:hypothetical protein [Micromonospora phaseoli]PZW00508.1 hypothetical protein CLV64_103537 [Micromonospora phaseoli]GIJ81432.1 hypothetical protein Xph01_58640 [Micromonospora phaseoli]SEK07317.1 hypothetical protein SAMN05443287_1258 [Micromonospora phaseoli]
MRRRAFNWSTRVIGAALGIWVADLLLPGVRLDGPAARTLLALLLAAVLVFVATVALPAPGYWLLNKAKQRAQESFEADDYDLIDPIFVIGLVGVLGVVLGLAVWSLVAPLALLLAARADLGLSVDGYGVAVTVALTTLAVWPLVRWPFHRPGQVAREVFKVALTLAAFALTLALVGGVWLEPGPGWLQLLTLAVLAQLYHMVWFEVTGPYLALPVRLTLAGLKLWVLSWLSGWSETPLRIEGFWSFGLAALIVVTVLWPLRLLEQQRHDAHDDLQRHMDLHQQMMSRPYY